MIYLNLDTWVIEEKQMKNFIDATIFKGKNLFFIRDINGVIWKKDKGWFMTIASFENEIKKEAILEKAERDYPLGTRIKSLYDNEPNVVRGKLKWNMEIISDRLSSFVYRGDKWAEIIERPLFKNKEDDFVYKSDFKEDDSGTSKHIDYKMTIWSKLCFCSNTNIKLLKQLVENGYTPNEIVDMDIGFDYSELHYDTERFILPTDTQSSMELFEDDITITDNIIK